MVSELSNNEVMLGGVRPSTHLIAWRNGKPVECGELFAAMDAWRALLEKTAGDNFALFMSDSIEFAAALFGALQSGKKVFLPSDALPATCASLSRSVDGFLGEFPDEWKPLAPSAAIASGVQTEDRALVVPKTAEMVIYTSGSTGDAQAIGKRFTQLLAEVASLEKLFGQVCKDADVVSTVSHQHIYGLLFKVLWPLAQGRPVHVRSLNFPEELVAAASMRDAIVISSPAHLKRFPESTIWQDATCQIRAVFSSGGPLDGMAAMETGRLMGTRPVEIFGSSETGGIAWRQRQSQDDDNWQPIPNVEWRIDSASGALEIRSPHLPDASWFRMADRVSASDGNRFRLLGRMDRIVKIEEKRVSLDAIEKQLATSPFVSAARVVPVDMGKGRQRIGAVVVPNALGKQVLVEIGRLAFSRKLRDLLVPVFERVALPKLWRYPDQMPVNAQGKTTYAELKTLLDASSQAASEVATDPAVMPNMRLLEQGTEQVTLELVVPRNLLYLEGHFPGSPILPGVVQVDWAILFGRRYFELPSGFRGIRMLKFQHVIQPETPVILELLLDAPKSVLAFRYFSSDGQHASGRIQFGEAYV